MPRSETDACSDADWCIEFGFYSKKTYQINHFYKMEVQQYQVKVLDVPWTADNFYLNLMDWREENMLAMAIGSDVYLKKEHGESVQKLERCDIGSAGHTSVAWSCDGKSLAVGCEESQIEASDVHVMHRITTFQGHTAIVGSFSWNGHILTSGSRDKYIINYDVRAGTGVYHLKGDRSEVCGLRWSLDGTRLASDANRDVVYVWHSLNMG